MPLSPTDYHYAADEYYTAHRVSRFQARAMAFLLGASVMLVPYFWPEAFGSVADPLMRSSHAAVGTPSLVYYGNCRAARAAGAAPILRGQPGYRPELDADDDGVACEPYRGR